MMNENTPDLYTLEDEDGKEQVFELLDVMELDGEKYFALTPYYDDPEKMLESDGEVVILKSVFEGDEEMMVSFDENEEEYDRVGEIFIKRLEEMYDIGDEDEEEDPQ
ncbi:MAG: DUF1292 domain-containing protein [Ruminococcus sp.]|nr:DUF1292 domain-containing protein [Ruminococcus sp.]MBR6874624.1 DUF1292 domain-containing protein [Ruminococcus sp.]